MSFTIQNNHELYPIDQGVNSSFYFTHFKPKNLIVFVHGLGGHAENTWEDFQIFIKNYSEFKYSDVIFYGYDSLKNQASSNALLFEEDLQDFLLPKKDFFGFKRNCPDKYEKIIFVAHSLGAIIVRRALLFACESNPEWLERMCMMLIAPAHLGSHVPERVIQVLPSMLKITAGVARHFMPALEDVKVGSETIKNLKTETIELINTGKGEFTKASVVLWALNDRIVLNERFCKDPKPKLIKTKDHITICKPIVSSYLKPVDFLIQLL